MKVLLINPPLFNMVGSTAAKDIEELDSCLPPLGLMYVAAYLEKYSSHQVKIVDCPFEKYSFEEIAEIIKKERPDVIGISVLTFTLIDAFEVIRIAREQAPASKIILGGTHVNIYPNETMLNKRVDFLVLGEGEETFKKLLDNINNIGVLKQIPGLVFRTAGEIIKTAPPSLIQNLDALPFPARNLTNYKKYASSLAKKFPVTTMFTSRGCPFRCLFCDRPHFKGIFRARSAASVVDEMQECCGMGIKEIFLYDDTFTVNRKRVLDICSEIEKRGLEITWDIRARVDTVDEEVLRALKKAGCERIHFGIEAGTEKILKVLNKGITLSQAEKAIALSKKIGISALTYFMIGSPTETKEDILATFKFIKKINPDYALISITTPYPATALYRMGLEQKILPYDYWQEFAKNPTKDFQPLYWEEHLTKDELQALADKGYRDFYLRPSYIIKRLIKIRSFWELKTKVSAGLKLLKL